MNLIKTITLIITIAIITLLFSSCTSKASYIDDVEDEAPLSIYLLQDDYFDSLMKDHIQAYNRLKPKENRPIEITEFKSEEDMYARILNEISAGKGPDIISTNTKTDKYIDINKISKQNCFADIDILIENSNDFNLDDYNKTVLDAGIIDGKRVFMPLSYKVEYLIGVEECFKNNNIEIPDKLTLDIYLNILEQYYQNKTNKPTKTGKIEIINLLSTYFEYGKPLEKSDKLLRLFKLLKIENEKELTYIEEFDPISYYEKFINNNSLFMKPFHMGYIQFRRLYEHYNVIENRFQSNIIVFNQPFYITKSYIENIIAININSKHKNEAFDFVQFMLSEHVQSNSFKMIDLPVNNDSYEYEVYNLVNNIIGQDIFFTAIVDYPSDIPEKTKNDFIEYIESAETCEYIGNLRYVYHNIMSKSIEDYYNDRLTFDEMIDEINNKLSIYYSE
jgi:multiple sugar transport system substrate-binding protein